MSEYEVDEASRLDIKMERNDKGDVLLTAACKSCSHEYGSWGLRQSEIEPFIKALRKVAKSKTLDSLVFKGDE